MTNKKEALEDIQLIRNIAGDVEYGLAGPIMRGQIGPRVTVCCDRLEKYIKKQPEQ